MPIGSSARHPNSNYGSKPDDDDTVDIYGPYTLWTYEPDPSNATIPTNVTVTLQNGTSIAAPFVAGVAALIKAANPDLSTGDIERILRDTAETHNISPEVHHLVRAADAVLEALPNDPPVCNVSVDPNQPQTEVGRTLTATSRPRRGSRAR
jgi:serine protease